MTACLISGLFTIGIVLMISGLIMKNLIGVSSKIAFHVGQGLYMLGIVLILPTMYVINPVFAAVLFLFAAAFAYVEHSRFKV